MVSLCKNKKNKWFSSWNTRKIKVRKAWDLGLELLLSSNFPCFIVISEDDKLNK